MIQLDFKSRSRIKNPIPIPSVLRNPTPTPPSASDSLRLRHRLRNPAGNVTYLHSFSRNAITAQWPQGTKMFRSKIDLSKQ